MNNKFNKSDFAHIKRKRREEELDRGTWIACLIFIAICLIITTAGSI